MLATALRVGEATVLAWSDVHLVIKRFRVSGQLQRIDVGMTAKPGEELPIEQVIDLDARKCPDQLQCPRAVTQATMISPHDQDRVMLAHDLRERYAAKDDPLQPLRPYFATNPMAQAHPLVLGCFLSIFLAESAVLHLLESGVRGVDISLLVPGQDQPDALDDLATAIVVSAEAQAGEAEGRRGSNLR